jgi:hypothetical protein
MFLLKLRESAVKIIQSVKSKILHRFDAKRILAREDLAERFLTACSYWSERSCIFTAVLLDSDGCLIASHHTASTNIDDFHLAKRNCKNVFKIVDALLKLQGETKNTIKKTNFIQMYHPSVRFVYNSDHSEVIGYLGVVSPENYNGLNLRKYDENLCENLFNCL